MVEWDEWRTDGVLSGGVAREVPLWQLLLTSQELPRAPPKSEVSYHYTPYFSTTLKAIGPFKKVFLKNLRKDHSGIPDIFTRFYSQLTLNKNFGFRTINNRFAGKKSGQIMACCYTSPSNWQCCLFEI